MMMQYSVVLCSVLFAFCSVVLCQGYDFHGPSVTRITEPVDHSESPHWDGRRNILYYVDIHSGGILAYHYKSQKVTKIHLNGEVTPVIPSKKDANILLVGLNRSLVAVEWNGEKKLGDQEVLTTISKEFPKSRFNDGKADSKGRLWWGTMGPEENLVTQPNQGILYKFTKDEINEPTIAIAPVSVSNGLAWNKANDKFYYIDTPTKKIIEFDYDAEKGELSKTNRTVFDVGMHSDKITGVPDGMTIDEEDNLYIALYGGGAVIKVNSKTGELMQIIPIPARDVTCPVFGGPNLDILFVSTSRVSLTPSERLYYPGAGSLFAVKNLKAKGLPANPADIIDSIPKKLNLLENLFTPDLFSPPEPKRNSRIIERNTELPLWQTILNTLRSIF